MASLCHPDGCGACSEARADEAGYWCRALAVDDADSRLLAWLAAGPLGGWRFWLYCRIARWRYGRAE